MYSVLMVWNRVEAWYQRRSANFECFELHNQQKEEGRRKTRASSRRQPRGLRK
jgi:hypothetical protein